MARRLRKHRKPRPRNEARSGFYWLLTGSALAALGWFWWQSAHSGAPSQAPLAPVKAEKTAPPEPKTNAPVVEKFPAPQPVPLPVVEPAAPVGFPRPVRTILEAQVALARQGISSGSLDGRIGIQTRGALAAFQRKEHLPPTGDLDAVTTERLQLSGPLCSAYTITPEDLDRLQPLQSTWLGKSQQSALEYETVLELLAEKGQAHPGLIRQLNPAVDWSHVEAGTTVQLPNEELTEPRGKAAFVTISLSEKVLEAFDAKTNLLLHFPCSIARHVEKRPVGELHVAVIALNPNYTFDPAIFPESAEARELDRKLILPPGPNNPVGVVWLGLDKPGYGIHGTPSPEQVGRTESHGCFRLANWNVQRLAKVAWVGLPVFIEP